MTASTGTPRTARIRRAMRYRVLVSGVSVAAIVALLGASSTSPAGADVTGMPLGSSLSRAAQVDPGTGVALTATGATGLLATLTSTLINGLVNPIAQLPVTTTTSIANGLATAGYQARNPTSQQPRPTPDDNYPRCGTQGWDSTDCYSATPTAPAVSALLSVGGGTVRGYATGDDKGYIAASGVSHPTILAPGFTIDLGVAASTAKCDTQPTCTATHSLTGGTITPTNATALNFTLASGNALATVAGTSINGANVAIPNVNGLTATANGSLLTFNVSLTLTQLLAALGTTLPALSTGLASTLTDNGSVITLGVTVGPGDISNSSSTQASAWGADVGISLNADIRLSLLSLSVDVLGVRTTLGATRLVTSPPSGGTANLMDLKLAYSQANAGSLLPDFVPPGLI